MQKLRQPQKEELHPPVEAQVDYGEAKVNLNGHDVSVTLFAMTLPYSGEIFAPVFMQEYTETFLDGHRQALEFFGGVHQRIS